MSVEEVVLDVKKYVDENMAEIKEFVAGVVKKLPIPMDLTKEVLRVLCIGGCCSDTYLCRVRC